MTPRQLQTLILTGPKAAECSPHVHTNDMPKIPASEALAKDSAIAAILSEGRKEVRSLMISERGILSRYSGGPVAADAVLAKLEAVANGEHALASLVRRVMRFLGTADGIDIGDPATQAMIDALVAYSLLTEDEGTKLKALALHDAPFTAAEVSNAVRGPWDDA